MLQLNVLYWFTAGVHSAMQHDVIMNSADPDYMLVEAEASKVAKSAVKAMKASRRQCHNSIRWGRPTWTGSSGVAGAPGLRFAASALVHYRYSVPIQLCIVDIAGCNQSRSSQPSPQSWSSHY